MNISVHANRPVVKDEILSLPVTDITTLTNSLANGVRLNKIPGAYCSKVVEPGNWQFMKKISHIVLTIAFSSFWWYLNVLS